MVRFGAFTTVLRYTLVPNFNFSMVRFGDYTIETYLAWKYISIPVWCDSETTISINLEVKSIFQFQYGAIRRTHIHSWVKNIKQISIPVWCDSESL